MVLFQVVPNLPSTTCNLLKYTAWLYAACLRTERLQVYGTDSVERLSRHELIHLSMGVSIIQNLAVQFSTGTLWKQNKRKCFSLPRCFCALATNMCVYVKPF